jgi:hypothetical protein
MLSFVELNAATQLNAAIPTQLNAAIQLIAAANQINPAIQLNAALQLFAAMQYDPAIQLMLTTGSFPNSSISTCTNIPNHRNASTFGSHQFPRCLPSGDKHICCCPKGV